MSFEGQGGERVRIPRRNKVNSLPFKVAKERLYNDPGCSEIWRESPMSWGLEEAFFVPGVEGQYFTPRDRQEGYSEKLRSRSPRS